MTDFQKHYVDIAIAAKTRIHVIIRKQIPDKHHKINNLCQILKNTIKKAFANCNNDSLMLIVLHWVH